MNLAERLQGARANLKLTLEAVAERTELGVSTLSEFENGRREPRIGQLKKLADTYRRSLAYFLDDAVPSPNVVLWRQRPDSPSAEELQSRLLQLAEQYHVLEVVCDQTAVFELPHVSESAEQFDYATAQRLAHRVRNDLALGDRPGQTLLRLLEEVCNVKVFHLDFEPSGCAACTVSSQFGAAILLNSKNVRWRRNFDLAHELFHLLTWETFRHDSDSTAVAPDTEERLATCFARNLLMPVEAFREAVNAQRKRTGKLGFDNLFEIAREFDVSIEAVLWQMRFVFNTPEESIRATLESLKGRIRFWDQREQDSPPDRPLRYYALARQALRKGLISTGRYADLVGISRREAMKLVDEDAEEDVQVEVADS
jgi:Zn-dependent peptidase ImmA (M78 family)/transcriptional regulator with XRE-family HTH domain